MSYEPVLHVVLYHPEIPYNAGNVGRTCVAVGAKLWMVRPLGFQVDDYYVRRAGLDYWEMLEWEVVDDWPALLDRLPQRKFWYFTKTAARSYAEASYQPSDVLVFGCESQGLPRSLVDANQDQALRIPMREEVRSLNLSNCAAIICYEAQRQWAAGEPGRTQF